MQRYKDFQPTGFDPKGLNAERYEIGEFLVLPCGQNRDSDVLSKANFQAALRELGGESETVQVHRFGHWGPGWFELILVDSRDQEKVKIADEIEASLEDYPILDESLFSEMEWNAAYDWWQHMGMKERIRVCDKYRVSIFATRRDEIPEEVDISYLAE